MSHLLDQIAIEKQRIAVFEAKIAHCKKRIESLEYLLQDSDDELDTLALSAGVTRVPVNAMGKTDTGGYVRSKPIGAIQLSLLKFIGTEGKSLKDVVRYAKENNLGISAQNVRNFAMMYRSKYGYITNPYIGFYRLTESGINAIK